MFAIALTLLVVGIGVPRVADASDLVDELSEVQPEIISFFISFTVIGFYWKGQHATFAMLKAVDGGYITLNLAYLALIAFLPFPTALVGAYEEEPVTVVIYAVTLGAASAMEFVMFLWTVRRDLLIEPLTPRGRALRRRRPAHSRARDRRLHPAGLRQPDAHVALVDLDRRPRGAVGTARSHHREGVMHAGVPCRP